MRTFSWKPGPLAPRHTIVVDDSGFESTKGNKQDRVDFSDISKLEYWPQRYAGFGVDAFDIHLDRASRIRLNGGGLGRDSDEFRIFSEARDEILNRYLVFNPLAVVYVGQSIKSQRQIQILAFVIVIGVIAVVSYRGWPLDQAELGAGLIVVVIAFAHTSFKLLKVSEPEELPISEFTKELRASENA